MPSPPKYWALIPAAGSGQRMQQTLPKQYLTVNGITLAEHTVSRLLAVSVIHKITVAVAGDDPYWQQLACANQARVQTCIGGAERFNTVLNGLEAMPADDDDWVLVHDLARPCVRVSDVVKLMQELKQDPVGGILAVPVRDTMKQSCLVPIKQEEKKQEGNVNGDSVAVLKTVPRENLWHALTPQMFRYGLLKRALLHARDSQSVVTDEAQAVERIGFTPKIVFGSRDNLKVTFPEDLKLAQFYLQEQEKESDGVSAPIALKQ